MAIRGPGGRPDGVPPPSLTSSPSSTTSTASPIGRLVQFGAAQTPQEAKKVLGELLALLAAGGFPVPKTGSPEAQLQSSLKSFQRDAGLPVTGTLDKATMSALEERGLMPGRGEAVEKADPAAGRLTDRVDQAVNRSPFSPLDARPGLGLPRGGPGGGAEVPGQKGRALETEQTALRAEQSRPDVEVDLKSMLQSLKAAGFMGAGKGKEQLQDAVKKLQRVDGLPATGKLDAKTAESLERRGVLDSATAQALKEQDPAWAPTSKNAESPDQERRSALEGRDPTTAGAREGQEAQGRGGEGLGTGQGTHGGEGLVKSGVAGGDGRVDDGDPDGASDQAGNAPAGDEDLDDDDRGGANVDDEDALMGRHWQVPPMREQVQGALVRILRDDDGHGPATYGWEIVLHRPGVYAEKQPAEEVLKLVVSAAGPFDPVWRQALNALNERLRRFDDDADPIAFDVVERALQQARYRRDSD